MLFEWSDSLRYQLYENKDPGIYGFSRKAGAVNGSKVKNLMMALNARVTENTYSDETPIDCFDRKFVSASLENARIARPTGDVTINNRLFIVETCYYWSTCTGDGNGNCVTEPVYHQECVTHTYWIEDDWSDGEYQEPGSGGSGGEGGGTGTGGGGTGEPGSCSNPPLTEPLPPVDPSSIGFIPCPSSFNMVQNGNQQAAVITDYRWSFYNYAGNKLTYPIDIGMVEITLPYITYKGEIIHHDVAQNILAQAARDAEAAVTAVLSAYLIANPHIIPTNLVLTPYVKQFKETWMANINYMLKHDFYDGDNVKVAGVSTNIATFTVTDHTKWRTLKYWGKDCH